MSQIKPSIHKVFRLFMVLMLAPLLANTAWCQSDSLYQAELNLAQTNQSSGDLKEATRFLNEAAMKAWENRELGKAIEYFERSLKLNWKIDNFSGISKIQNNLALIYADSGLHSRAMINFEKSLKYRRENGEKSEIISNLINIAVVLNNLKEHQKAAEHLEEALQLATEMNDPELMKSCYIMLSETYEKQGDYAKTMHYFNLYRTFHEMVQRHKEIKYTQEIEEAQVKSLRVELENKNNQLDLMARTKALAETEERLESFNEETQTLIRSLMDSASKQELAIELLKSENELKELRLSEANTTPPPIKNL